MNSTIFKYYIYCSMFVFSYLGLFDNSLAANALNKKPKTGIEFTPPPIPEVNTPAFKKYVREFHTFPSPFGFEPYKNKEGKATNFPINEINPINPYIPVTFYCNASTCPRFLAYLNDSLVFEYDDKDSVRLSLGYYNSKKLPQAIIGFYLPDDPVFHTQPGLRRFNSIKKGDPLITVLFSQRVLQNLSELNQGIPIGFIAAKEKNRQLINHQLKLPLANGKENLAIGTTLYVIGLGEASGVEFTETVAQTTGESYTNQVQTGFTINFNIETDIVVGGGIVPASSSLKVGVNAGLSSLVSNSITIENQKTTSRSYTIKPGINDTYYWAIYQLGYSYYLHAPLLDAALKTIQTDIWKNVISYKIADNSMTKDNKPIGNILPPQAPSLPNDITVGVAVPINPGSQQNLFTQNLSAK